MTKRQGMLWKSAWKRRTGYGQGQPRSMWFINLAPDSASSNEYRMAAPAPFAFQSVPFWIGWIWAGYGVGGNQPFVIQSGGSTFATTLGNASSKNAVSQVMANIVTTLDADVQSDVRKYAPLWQPGSVVVSLAVVQQVGADLQLDLWMDGALRNTTTATGITYAVPAGQVSVTFQGSTANTYAQNFAAGSGVPTDTQIRTWFAEVRNNAQIQTIPGMTTDVFDATVVQPLAPAIIPNGGGGQQFDLTTIAGPPATNELLDVFFSY